ncbi:MAG: hypothetical protein M3Q14_04425 [bacterium]|nr:hypothetical protein [bacterium]
MAKKRKLHSKVRAYAQIINPIHHLERTIEILDKENDRLQQRVFLLGVFSVVLAITGVLLALFYNN